MEILNIASADMPISNKELTKIFFDTSNLDVNDNPYLTLKNKNGSFVIGGGTGGATTLASLTDVDVTGVANGQALVYNGGLGKWDAVTVPLPTYYQEDIPNGELAVIVPNNSLYESQTGALNLFADSQTLKVELDNVNNKIAITAVDGLNGSQLEVGKNSGVVLASTYGTLLSNENTNIGANFRIVANTVDSGNYFELIAPGTFVGNAAKRNDTIISTAGNKFNINSSKGDLSSTCDFSMSGVAEINYIKGSNSSNCVLAGDFYYNTSNGVNSANLSIANNGVITFNANQITANTIEGFNLSVGDNINIETFNANGILRLQSGIANAKLAFFGAAGVAKQSISLSSGTLSDIINALGAYGLINVTA